MTPKQEAAFERKLPAARKLITSIRAKGALYIHANQLFLETPDGQDRDEVVQAIHAQWPQVEVLLQADPALGGAFWKSWATVRELNALEGED